MKHWQARMQSRLGDLAFLFDFVENLLSMVAGPVLVLFGLIGTMQLLTGNDLLNHYGWLSMTWAGAMAVGVDIWLVLSARMIPRAWQCGERRSAFIWLMLMGLLAAVAFEASWATYYAASQHVGPEQALAAIGVSAVFWAFQRAFLIPALIIVSTRIRTQLASEAREAEELLEDDQATQEESGRRDVRPLHGSRAA